MPACITVNRRRIKPMISNALTPPLLILLGIKCYPSFHARNESSAPASDVFYSARARIGPVHCPAMVLPADFQWYNIITLSGCTRPMGSARRRCLPRAQGHLRRGTLQHLPIPSSANRRHPSPSWQPDGRRGLPSCEERVLLLSVPKTTTHYCAIFRLRQWLTSTILLHVKPPEKPHGLITTPSALNLKTGFDVPPIAAPRRK